MLEYIKKQVSEKIRNSVPIKEEFDDTALIAEYASVFAELDDISIEGDETEDEKDRPFPVNIPLDDDGDIDLEDEITLNLSSGRITDTPADAAIQSEYATMKTVEDFYTEASNEVYRYRMETEPEYNKRVKTYVNEQFMNYRNEVLQEGYFGYNKMNVSNEAFPSFIMMNFGPIGNNESPDYVTKLEVKYQVDDYGRATRNQLETTYLAESAYISESLMPKVKEYMKKNYDSYQVWDDLTPSELIVPVDPINSHSFIIGFKNNLELSKPEYFRFSNPVMEFATDSVLENATVEHMDVSRINGLNHFTITRNNAIREETHNPYPNYRRYYQEAIDMGAQPPVNAAPAPDMNSGVAPAPDINMDGNVGMDPMNMGVNQQPSTAPDMNQMNQMDPNMMGGAPTQPGMMDPYSNMSGVGMDPGTDPTQQQPEIDDNKPAIDVSTNNVSDKIAANVAAETDPAINNDMTDVDSINAGLDDNDNNLDNIGDENFDGTDMGALDDNNNGLNNADDSNESIESQLNQLDDGLDNTSNDDGSDGDIDIDNLSMEDLIAQGTEKLKGMTIGDLKQFLNNNDMGAVQEAFILTDNNIDMELSSYIKKCLGVLNDSKLELPDLITEFKKQGKHLNRIATKASKMKNHYSDEQIIKIRQMNKALGDLMATFPSYHEQNAIVTIKKLIKEFTNKAAAVSEFADSRAQHHTGKRGPKFKKHLKDGDESSNDDSHAVNESYNFDYVNGVISEASVVMNSSINNFNFVKLPKDLRKYIEKDRYSSFENAKLLDENGEVYFEVAEFYYDCDRRVGDMLDGVSKADPLYKAIMIAKGKDGRIMCYSSKEKGYYIIDPKLINKSAGLSDPEECPYDSFTEILKNTDKSNDNANDNINESYYVTESSKTSKVGKTGDSQNMPFDKLPKEYLDWLDKQPTDTKKKRTYYDIDDNVGTAVRLYNREDIKKKYNIDNEIRKGYESKYHYTESFVAVGESPFGDVLLINITSGKVSIWYHETCDQTTIASSWKRFIDKVKYMNEVNKHV